MCCLQTYAATSLITSKVILVSCAQLPLRLVLAFVQMSLLDGYALQEMVRLRMDSAVQLLCG